MGKIAGFVYGLLAYALFFGWFLYAVCFLGNFVVPKSIDSGIEGPLVQSLVIDVILVAVFAIQHTIMARPGFKSWWMRFVPKPIERSTFVLIASLLMWLLVWQWRPLLGVVWDIRQPFLSRILVAVSLIGWGIVLVASFMIDHFELFGLKQVWQYLRGKDLPPISFRLTGFYKVVRHPLMLGFLIAFWVTPLMTVGHFVFASAFTVYILIGTGFEERDLLSHHGKDYEKYRHEVSMLIPFIKRR